MLLIFYALIIGLMQVHDHALFCIKNIDNNLTCLTTDRQSSEAAGDCINIDM